MLRRGEGRGGVRRYEILASILVTLHLTLPVLYDSVSHLGVHHLAVSAKPNLLTDAFHLGKKGSEDGGSKNIKKGTF